MSEKSLSECYCTSGTHYVPDQWNSLAARCAKATYECTRTADYRCDLTEHASSSTDFCKPGSDAVKFHTESKRKVKPYTPTVDATTVGSTDDDDDDDRSMGCNEFNDADDCSDEDSSDESESAGSSGDSSPPEPAAAQPKPTSSADQVTSTAMSASPGSTGTSHTSHTSSSISSTLPSATSTSSARSLVATSNGLVSRIMQSWLLIFCALWLL